MAAKNQKLVAVFFMFMVALSFMQIIHVCADENTDADKGLFTVINVGESATLDASKKGAEGGDSLVDPMMIQNRN